MRTGTTIAHYEVGEILGRGGMGEVYRATDTRLDRPVALKFLASRFVSDTDAKDRFIREAKSASALDHPNICTIHDIGETPEGELYLVMAYYGGATLEDRLRTESFSVERSAGILRQVARALQRAHDGGIVHRDIKPANIMVGSGDQVRLLDFGVAKLQSSHTLTSAGETLGTAAYMSPEQATGGEITPAADVWALGAMAYEMLAGQQPFRASQPVAVVNQILTSDPTPLSEVAPDVPAPLASVVHRALAKEVDDRFIDAGAFLTALDAAGVGQGARPLDIGAAPTRGSAVTASPGGPADYPQPRTRPGTKLPYKPGPAIAVLVAVIAAVTWFATRPVSPDATDVAVSPDVVAILPFAVSGSPDLAYLGEGMMDLLGGRLDGAGAFRTVDPRALLGQLDDADRDDLDLSAAAEAAESVGAGRFVTGQLVGLPGSVSLSARLYGTDEPSEDQPVVSVEGSEEELLSLVDELATGLLETSMTGANARIQQSAAQSAASLPATKAFLRGEQFHRRGMFDSAAYAYNAALAADSTFALAHLMKSMNNMYTYDTDDYVAAEKAWEYSEGLPERDRSLILAFLNQQGGKLDEAEEQYLAHLKRWPDEVKALLMLGVLYQRSNQRWARSMDQASVYFDRVLELEPENVPALHRGARLDAPLGRLDRLEERARTLERVAPSSEWTVDVVSMSAYARQDEARIAALTRDFPSQSLLIRVYAVYSALRFSPDPSQADRLLRQLSGQSVNTNTGLPDRVTVSEDLMVWTRILADVFQGRHNAARDFLSSSERDLSDAWVLWDAELLTADIFPIEDSLLEEGLARVRAVDTGTRMQNHFEPLHDIFTADVARLEKDVFIARLLGRLGRFEEAWAIQRDIEGRPPYRAFESLREDAAGGLAADLLHLQGEGERALEILRSLPYQLPATANSLSITQASHARFLRAKLEMDLDTGDPEAARYLLEGLVNTFAPSDKLFVSEVYERLGQLHEAAGREDQSAFYYQKFAQAWANPDEELLPRRDAALERVAALSAQDRD